MSTDRTHDCAVDVGLSTTDAVASWATGAVVSIPSARPEETGLLAVERLLDAHPPPCGELRIAATGLGARRLPATIRGGRVFVIDEIRAIGIGGARLAGLHEALVVSLGTGTALVSVSPSAVRHLFPGTGVGGGTLLGLGELLVGERDLSSLAALAARGDHRRLDLTIGEVAGTSSSLPSGATASNFAKRDGSRPSREDIAAALANLVAEVVLTTVSLGLQASGHGAIVATGKLLEFGPIRDRFETLSKLFPVPWHFPERAGVATALGALWTLEEMRS